MADIQIISEDKDVMYRDGKMFSTTQSVWEFKHRNYDPSNPMVNMPTLWFDVESFKNIYPECVLKNLGNTYFSVTFNDEHIGNLLKRHIYKCNEKMEK